MHYSDWYRVYLAAQVPIGGAIRVLVAKGAIWGELDPTGSDLECFTTIWIDLEPIGSVLGQSGAI